jgi:hypothetical protein
MFFKRPHEGCSTPESCIDVLILSRYEFWRHPMVGSSNKLIASICSLTFCRFAIVVAIK